MTEGTPLTPEQLRQMNRDLMEKVIDKAASDPKWKQWLLDEPEAAIREAGFPEAQRLQQMRESAELSSEEEVYGHMLITDYQDIEALKRDLIHSRVGDCVR